MDSELDKPAKVVNKRAQPAPKGSRESFWGGGRGGRGGGRGRGRGARSSAAAEQGTRDGFGNVVCDWAEEEQPGEDGGCAGASLMSL